MNRPAFRILALALLPVLAACGQGGKPEKSAARLIYSTADLRNPFWQRVAKGVEDAARKQGVQIKVLSADGSSTKQLQQIEDILQTPCSALLVSPYDGSAIGSAIKAANHAKVPVIVVDIGADSGRYESLIVSDNRAGGRLAGEHLAKLLQNRGPVAHITAQPGVENARQRGEGFKEVMKRLGIKIAATQTAYSDRNKAADVMESLLQAHPDLRGVFCENDEMALGALAALSAAGKAKQVKVVGFDGNSEALTAIKQGRLAGTVAQQPEDMGRMGVEIALRVLRHQKVAHRVQVPVKLLKAEGRRMKEEVSR